MNKSDLYKLFTDKIYDCSLQNNLSYEIITSQKEKLINQFGIHQEEDSTIVYTHCGNFYSWGKNRIINYGKKDLSVSELWNNTIYYHNKLYQWLLVTAFEAYEKYLKDIFPFISDDPIPNSAGKILIKVRQKLPKYKKIEKKTICEISHENISLILQNLGLSGQKVEVKNKKTIIDNSFNLALIEKMRHQIVHANGLVLDRKTFLKEILESVGIYNNGKYDNKYQNTIDSYFDMSFGDEIILLEIPLFEVPVINARTDVLNNLFSIMLNSAFFIHEEIE